MADITMCQDKACPKKETCYRYTAPVSMRQSYFLNSPRKDDACDFYWPNEGRAKAKK